MRIQIDEQQCAHCGNCSTVCPSRVLRMGDEKVPYVTNEKACIVCGHCVDVCAKGAISHADIPADSIHRVNRDILPSPASVLELMRSRRSNRTIDRSRDIPESVLQDILEAAHYAPTAENSRKVTVTLLPELSDVKRVEDWVMDFFMRLAKVLLHPLLKPLGKCMFGDLYDYADELVSFERRRQAGEFPCCCNARVLLAFSTPANYDFCMEDCNLAYQNASLMAESHGVSQIYMGLVVTAAKWMGRKRTARKLGLPEGHRLGALMALGIPSLRYSNYIERK